MLKKKLKYITVLLVLFSSCLVAYAKTKRQKYIDFELPDLSSGVVRLSKIVGKKVVLLTFWTTWCPCCQREIPLLNKLRLKYEDEGLEVISINIHEFPRYVRRYVKRKRIGYRVLLDRDAKVAKAYKVMGIPTNIVIDKDGYIVFRDYVLPSEEKLKKWLSELEAHKRRKGRKRNGKRKD